MPADPALADRVRRVLHGRRDVLERRMFGGVAFLVNGNMACGVVGSDLVVRVGPEAYASCLREPGVRPMDFTGRPLRGFVYVEASAYAEAWVRRGLAYAGSLPAK